MRPSVAPHLVVVLEISKIFVWKSAARFGDLRQGQAVNRGLQREQIFVRLDASGVQCLHYWQPFPPVSSTFPRAVHAHWPPYARRACKRGMGACARSRGGAAHRRSTGVFRSIARSPTTDQPDQVRSAGARSPCSAGTPFAVTSDHLALFLVVEWRSPCG